MLKIGIENGEIIMNYSVLNCYFLDQKDKIENHCYFESKQIKQINKQKHQEKKYEKVGFKILDIRQVRSVISEKWKSVDEPEDCRILLPREIL